MSITLSTIAKIATIIRGLNFLMPYQLCEVGSSFAIKRFGYEEDAVSIFVAFCRNAMELFCLYAALSTFAIVTILKASAPRMFTQISSGISMVSACLTLFVNTLLLRLYALDEDINNITRYYWLLVLAFFAAGVDDTCVLTIAPEYFSNYDLGISTSGLVLVFFHSVVLKVVNSYNLNVDYWLIVCQILFMFVLSAVAVLLWFWFLMQHKIAAPISVQSSSRGSSFSLSGFAKAFAKCLPMTLGTSIALSVVSAVYPIIAPYELVKFDYYYPIQRVCLVFDTIAAVVVWLLDAYAGVQSDWYRYPYAWWHLIWLSFIPYLGLTILFIRCLHYPESGLHRVVLGSPFVVGVLTVVYYWLGCFNIGFCLVPISRNSDGYHEIISPMARAISLVTMCVLEYMSEAYVQEFKLAKEGLKAGKAWPTDGMSKHSAIRYWIRIAATVGYANFRNLATADVKQRLGGVARHIVTDRRASSVE